VYFKKITMDETKVEKLKEILQLVVAVISAVIVVLEKYQESASTKA